MNKVLDGKIIEKHRTRKFRTRFLATGAKLTFAKWEQVCMTVLILSHLNLKYFIQIETNA